MLLIPCGVVTAHSIRFMLSTTAIIFTRTESLQYLWYQIYRLGMRPDSLRALASHPCTHSHSIGRYRQCARPILI